VFTPALNIIFSCLSAFLITFVAIPKVIFFAERLRLIDLAGERASHKGSVPIFGGIAIFAGVMFSLLFWSELANIQFILASLLIIFFVGVIDDLLALSPVKKLIGQIISVLIIIYLQELRIDNMQGVLGIYGISEIVSTVFTVFVVIVITNAFNLIDGVDGLAGGIGIIASAGFGFIAFVMGQFDMALIAFTLTGALAGFLKYNFHPARIFMGDTGSLVVGMILSILAINSIQVGLVTDTIHLSNKGPLLAIVFLAIPLFDSLRVFVNRASQGGNPLLPSKGHIHHVLLDLGFGHKHTTLILYLVSILTILTSYFLLNLNLNISITLLALVSYIFILLPFYILRKRSK
jgi:UDP-N-acetylmuramyl pentapeptide phosphotransferase/UDP-N-acetylglucosamine-1-phosphate transferase